MARVCPSCRRMTADDEMQCLQCGQPTVDPPTWQEMRRNVIAIQDRLIEQSTAASNLEADKAADERHILMGLGGMAAFLLFFVVFLVAYLFLAWT